MFQWLFPISVYSMELFTPNFDPVSFFLVPERLQQNRTKSCVRPRLILFSVLMNIHNLGEIKVNNHILNLIVLQLHETLMLLLLELWKM